MKKFLSILGLSMLLSMTSFAQYVDGGTFGTLSWEVTGPTGNYTLTVSGNGPMDWSQIGSPPWSKYYESIATAVIENGVTTIGDFAFKIHCALTSITIPNSITEIGQEAFYSCTLLPSITIPNKVTSIGARAFGNCSALTSINIPSSVITIGSYCFSGCSALTSITVENENPNYSSFEGVLFNKDKTILMFCPQGKTGEFIIPNSVTTIAMSAFGGSHLSSVTIPNSVTTIGVFAFGGSLLPSVAIPNSVTTIEEGTFAYCSALTSITIPNSVTKIGLEAFIYCNSLSSITIPESVQYIYSRAFASCSSLTTITIPESVQYIYSRAFANCSSLTLVNNLNPIPTNVSQEAFENVDVSACTLKVPTASVSAYQEADVWKDFNIVGGDYWVQLSVNNSEYGYVSGDGLYGANATATVTATANNGYKFVNWTREGTVVSTENPYSFTVIEDVALVANLVKEVGIEELQITNYELRVYPNPTTGELRIENGELRIKKIEVFDVYGKLLSTFDLQLSTNKIDISGFPSGVYFMKIATEAGVVVKKVVKQ